MMQCRRVARIQLNAAINVTERFGEMSLLDQGPRSATVTADSDMHLLVLGSREFSSLVNEVPTVAVRMMRGLAERLRSAERRQPQH